MANAPRHNRRGKAGKAAQARRRDRVLWLCAGGVAAVLGLGLIWGGGPLMRPVAVRDAARWQDVQQIARHVTCLATGAGAMPAALAPTPDCPDLVRQVDRFTDRPYRWRVLDRHRLRLCPGFEGEVRGDAPRGVLYDRASRCVTLLVLDLPPPPAAAPSP